MFNPELNQIVEDLSPEGSTDPRELPYSALFKIAGICPDYAFTVIPFLNRDQHYLHIPGSIVRINNFDGGLGTVDHTSIVEETRKYQSKLPEIPLIPLDLRRGIPPDFKLHYGASDLFIVNHGVILSGLDIHDPNAARVYLSSISNAARTGSILMVIDSEYENTYYPQLIASLIGASPLDDALNMNSSTNLSKAGIRPRHLNHLHQDNQRHLGDYLYLPESHENDKVFFYIKD